MVCLILVLLLSGCDSSVKKDQVSVQALYGDTILELPIKSRQDAFYAGLNNEGCYFKTTKSIRDIRKIVESYAEENSGKVLVLAPDSRLYLTFEADGNVDPFFLSQIGREHFMVSTMRYDLRFEGTEYDTECKHLLFPRYLVNDKRLEESALTGTIYEGVEYELALDAGVDDFYDFYSGSGWFDAEIRDGCLILKSFRGSEEHSQTQPLQIDYPIAFHFETHVGIPYFAFEKGE